ncbi:MAG: hypothetical protein HY744_21260 [Deltaproteobacteria bacterium]|nr:hypothetical protein [Deltaproteobacteria bacterium]
MLLAWVPLVVLGALRQLGPAGVGSTGEIVGRLCLLPLLVAALVGGLRGGLVAAAVVSLGELGHAPPGGAGRPGGQWIEIALYFAAGAVVGAYADRERRRRAGLRSAPSAQPEPGNVLPAGPRGARAPADRADPAPASCGGAPCPEATGVGGPARPGRQSGTRAQAVRPGGDRRADHFVRLSPPLPREARAIDLRDVAQRLAELVGAQAHERGVDLQIQLPELPVMVRGDLDQLARAALSIVTSAMGALGGDGGVVRVSVQDGLPAKGAMMRGLRIESDGPRLADEEIRQLFDPHRGGDAEAEDPGLSLSQHIVEQHGGYIETANDGLGVAFTVRLPAATVH